MSCFGSSSNPFDSKKALEDIRSRSNLVCNININEIYKLNFDSNSGYFKTNLNEIIVEDKNEKIRKEEIINLQKQEKELSETIKSLEIEYQSKISELLIVTNVVRFFLFT